MAHRVETQRIRVNLRSGQTVTIPGWRVDSGTAGPCLLLTAAQHGNEVQGAEAIRRFVEDAAERLTNGRVFAVPMVNLPAVRERRPHIRMRPEQPYGDARGHNMNHWWSGEKSGNDTARLARAIYEAIGAEATHALDLHCWEKHKAGAVLVRDVPGIRELAGKLGHRFVDIRPPNDRSLGGYFCATGRVGITYEFSGQYVVLEHEVRHGLMLIRNLAKALGMLPGRLSAGHRSVLFSDECESVDVTAPCSGLFVTAPGGVYESVVEGRLLGHVLSDIDLSVHQIHAPTDGYLRVFGASRANCDVAMPGHHPYVTKGERLATVAFKVN